MLARPAPLLLLVSLCACRGGDPAPVWISLAAGFEPAQGLAQSTDLGGGIVLTPATDEDAPHASWLAATVARVAWAEVVPGVWVAPRPVGNAGWMQRAGASVELEGGGRSFVYREFSEEMAGPESTDPGSFTVVIDEVFLRLLPGEEPPPKVRYRVLVEHGQAGEGPTHPWRVPIGYLSADGLPLWPGQAQEVRFAGLTTPATLRFSAAAVAAHAAADADPDAVLGQVHMRVSLDGEELWSSDLSVGAHGTAAPVSIALPADVRAGALRFEVEGGPALCAILDPVLGPADPAPSTRPDVVLFLADTFRADNLAAYGGELGVAPNMDAFAAGGLVFRDSRSPAVWTLPSQASMMSGVWPLQHGVVHEQFSIPPDVETIAERFAAAGYRTGAVTDGVLVSRRHGFEQGFQWFDEEWHNDFGDTVDSVQHWLGLGDGRPSFLFVQSYRAHRPYRVTAETLAEHGERLGLDRTYAQVVGSFEGADAVWENGEGVIPDVLGADLTRLEGLYRAGVIDLDRGFGELLALLEQEGLRDEGYLLLTADHGEAFGEHDVLWHLLGVWEEQVRIPLVLAGPGITPGVVDHPAGLVDVSPTLAALAGVAPDTAWPGTPLHELDHDRPSFSFECGKQERQHVAIVGGGCKLIGPQDLERLARGEVWHAFDLTRDPAEAHDLAGTDADPSADLLRSLLPELADLSQPVFVPVEAAVGHLDEEAMRAIGYQ